MVTQAALTVADVNELQEYAHPIPVFTASYGGFKNGETLATSGVTGSPSLTTTATATSSVAGGPYTITAAVGTLAAGNYSFSFASGEQIGTASSRTVTADDKAREYVEANPVFTASYGGSKNGETFATRGDT